MLSWIIAILKYVFIYRQFVIDLFYYVENEIPDDTENKSLAKLDLFLKKFKELHQRLTGCEPTEELLKIAVKKVDSLAVEANKNE